MEISEGDTKLNIIYIAQKNKNWQELQPYSCSICIPHRTLAPPVFFFCSGVEQELHLVFCGTHVHIPVCSSCLEKRLQSRSHIFLPYLVDKCMYVKMNILFMYFQGICVCFKLEILFKSTFRFSHLMSKKLERAQELYIAAKCDLSATGENRQAVLVQVRIRTS